VATTAYQRMKYVPLCPSVWAITKYLSHFKVEILHGCHTGAEGFGSHILMRDEIRVHICEPKSTWQSTERLHITSPKKMKCKSALKMKNHDCKLLG
jgi:hypothetical protein